VLHSPDWSSTETLKVEVEGSALFAMSGTIDILRAIAEGSGPAQWLIALGYAGWGEGQLDEEMTRHGWFAVPSTSAMLFDTPTDERWLSAFKAEGIDPRLLVGQTGVA
jgi:putative transcriptional regulator